MSSPRFNAPALKKKDSEALDPVTFLGIFMRNSEKRSVESVPVFSYFGIRDEFWE